MHCALAATSRGRVNLKRVLCPRFTAPEPRVWSLRVAGGGKDARRVGAVRGMVGMERVPLWTGVLPHKNLVMALVPRHRTGLSMHFLVFSGIVAVISGEMTRRQVWQLRQPSA